MPRAGFEPTLPCGKRILSPPRLPFRHLGTRLPITIVLCTKRRPAYASGAFAFSIWRRRADSNRRIGVLQTPALDHLATSPLKKSSMVPRRRFELLRAFAHCPLKTACLPIPPPRHGGTSALPPPALSASIMPSRFLPCQTSFPGGTPHHSLAEREQVIVVEVDRPLPSPQGSPWTSRTSQSAGTQSSGSSALPWEPGHLGTGDPGARRNRRTPPQF